MTAPRPLDALELGAIYRELMGRRAEYAVLLVDLQRKQLGGLDDVRERLDELTRLANRVQEVATVGGFALSAAGTDTAPRSLAQ